MKINSHNEWDRLREVIVGTTEGMSVGLEFTSPGPVSEALFKKASSIAKKALPDWYRDEVAEDLDGLCKVLTTFGAKVLRPKPYGAENLFKTPNWSSSGKDIYNVRDIHTIVGNTVIVGPSPARCRYFEPDAFTDIWYHYFGKGFRWITAPKPKLVGKYLLLNKKSKPEETKEDTLHRKLGGGIVDKKHYSLAENEVLFDAANVIRLGRDLLYLVSSTGNRMGATWLQSILGDEYKVHTTHTYRSSHLDSTILPLHPGLVLLNAARVNPKNCPPILKSWKKIYFNDMMPTPEEEVDFQKNIRNKTHHELKKLGVESDLHEMSSPWAGLNVLMLDQHTVLVQDKQIKLIKELEKHKLTVVPVRMRHCYTMLGALHCSTLDTVRDSKLESYFK